MQKAFTLVEIIIVIMIMSVFIGVGFTTYTKQIQTQELDRQVDAFVTTLQLAKTKVVNRDISPNKNCSFSRYEVRVWQASNPPQYRIRFVCTTGPAPLEVALEMQQFNNMTVSGLSTNPADIQFYYPYGCLTANCGTAPTRSIRIRNPANGTCKSVSIDALGKISVSDTQPCAT